MYKDGCLYNGLFAARNVLASVVTIKEFAKLLDHPLLVRFLKRTHLPLPKYMDI